MLVVLPQEGISSCKQLLCKSGRGDPSQTKVIQGQEVLLKLLFVWLGRARMQACRNEEEEGREGA